MFLLFCFLSISLPDTDISENSVVYDSDRYSRVLPVHSLMFTVILTIFIHRGTDNENPSSESSLPVGHVF